MLFMIRSFCWNSKTKLLDPPFSSFQERKSDSVWIMPHWRITRFWVCPRLNIGSFGIHRHVQWLIKGLISGIPLLLPCFSSQMIYRFSISVNQIDVSLGIVMFIRTIVLKRTVPPICPLNPRFMRCIAIIIICWIGWQIRIIFIKRHIRC